MSSQSPIKIMMLSGACLTGQNVMATLACRRDKVQTIALNSDPEEPALYEFDHVRLVPELRKDPARFLALFEAAIQDFQPDIVVPCRDDDMLFLAEQSKRLPGMASGFLCGNADTASAMLNKLESWKFSETHALPFAPTIHCLEDPNDIVAFANRHGYPLICKPMEGFASKGISLVTNEHQLRHHIGAEQMIVQAFLGDPLVVDEYQQICALGGVPLFQSFEGLKVSIQTYTNADGSVGRIFVTENTMRQGRSELVCVSDEADAHDIGVRCTEAFAAAGWRGPLNIQCQRTPEGELYIYEFNGRFTGATSARYYLGYDEIGAAILDRCGVDISDGEEHSAVSYVKRGLVSRALRQQDVNELKEKGSWHAG